MSFVEDLPSRVAEYASSIGADYCDARLEERQSSSIRVAKGSVESASSRRSAGMGIRVLKNGAWGFVSIENLEWERVKEAVTKALKLAQASSSVKKQKTFVATAPALKDRVKGLIKRNPLDVPVEDKVGLALDTDKVLLSYKTVRDDRVRYSDTVYKKIIATSEGTEVVIEGARTRMVIYAVAHGNGVLAPSYEVIAKSMGYEVFEMQDPLEKAHTVAERATRLLDAEVPKGGEANVVLDNDLIGMIVHEAFGHTAEADHILSGSILAGRIGEKVASENVTIIDSPGPIQSYGWTPYDDEGVKGRDVVIVERGFLREYMQSRETAAKLGMSLTGNGRAEDYSYAPLVRMRTTYMKAGDWDPEEIIRDTKEGFYLKRSLHGQSDMNGVFMFVVQEAWRIKDGELAEPYRGVTLSGNAIEALTNIDAVGKDEIIDSPGTCGKLQLVPVDGGGPHVRTRLVVGGKA